MKLGLIGLPNSGKTTIFNALTKSEAQVTAYASEKAEPNLAVVEVLDERITHLSEMYKPMTLFPGITGEIGVLESSITDSFLYLNAFFLCLIW